VYLQVLNECRRKELLRDQWLADPIVRRLQLLRPWRKIHGLLCVRCGTEDGALVVLQDIMHNPDEEATPREDETVADG